MTDSIAKQCYDAVVTGIQALSLSGLETTEVNLRKVVRDRAHIHRGVTLAPMRATEAAGTNERDDFGYGVLVIFVQGTGNGYGDDIERVSQWRQQVRKTFHNKRLSGVTQSSVCSVQHGDPFLPKELQGQNDVSSLVIRCWTRETRT